MLEAKLKSLKLTELEKIGKRVPNQIHFPIDCKTIKGHIWLK